MQECLQCGQNKFDIVSLQEVTCKGCGLTQPRHFGNSLDHQIPAVALDRFANSEFLQGLSPERRAIIAARCQTLVNQIRGVSAPPEGYGQLTVKTLGADGFQVWSLCPCGCGHSTQVGSYPLDSRGIYEIIRVNFGQKARDTVVFCSDILGVTVVASASVLD